MLGFMRQLLLPGFAFLGLALLSGCASDPSNTRRSDEAGIRTVTEEQAKTAGKDRVIIALTSDITVERTKTAAAKCADAAFLRQEMEEGINECTNAIENDELSTTDLGNTYYNRGYLYFQLERYAEAEADFTIAIENEMQQLHKAYYARGLCKQNTNRARPAAADYAKALEIKPDWPWAQKKKKEFWWVYGDEYPY